MPKQRLTDRQLISGVTLTDLLHFVVTGDTSQNPAGSSYKGNVEQLFGAFSAYTCSNPLTVDVVNACTSGITINGNVVINGSATTINTEVIQSKDNNIVLNYSGTHLTAIGGGITLEDGVSDGVDSRIFTNSDGIWLFDPGLSASTGTIDTLSACTGVYTSNLYGCSPITVHDILQSTETPFGGFGSVTINDGSGGLILKSDSLLEGINAKLQTGNGTGYNTFEVEQISGGDGYLKIYVNDLNASFADRNQTYIVSKNNPNPFTTRLELANNSITADRTWTMPNNTGTVALISDIVNTYVTGGTFDNNTDTITFTNTSGGTFDVTGITDTFVIAGTFNDTTNTLSLLRNDGNFVNVSGFTSTFTGNTSGTCITDLFATNLYGCSPLHIDPSGLNNVYIVENGGNVGIGTTATTVTLDVAGETRLSGSGQNVLTVIGSGDTQPLFKVEGSSGELFSITDSLVGSLFSVNDISGLPILEVFDDDTVHMGSYQAPSLNTTVLLNPSTGLSTVYSIPMSAYTGAWFEYTVSNTGGARAGQIMSIFSGNTVNFTETTTTDIGSTSDVTFSMSADSTNTLLQVSATTSGWEVKTIVRSI